MDKAVTTGDWSDPCFVKAGADFKQLIALAAIPGRLRSRALGRSRQQRGGDGH